MANPISPETPRWEAAFEYYYRDEVEAALLEVNDTGMDDSAELLRWYRVMEAEAVTRQRSECVQINDWLSFEYIPDQTIGLEKRLFDCAVRACDMVGQRLRWAHTEPTRITILAEETDAPWATNPYGYCVAKDPFEKICLPIYLADDLEEFEQAIAHEYAHVVTSNLSNDLAPRWLQEAVSVLVENRFDNECASKFCSGETPWLVPNSLERTLVDRTDDDGTKPDIWAGYQQAGWIGRYLSGKYGDERLSDLIARIPVVAGQLNFASRLRGQSEVEIALRSVLGVSASELFEDARRWLLNQPLEVAITGTDTALM